LIWINAPDSEPASTFGLLDAIYQIESVFPAFCLHDHDHHRACPHVIRQREFLGVRIRPRNPLRAKTDFVCAFNAIPLVQPLAEKHSALSSPQINRILPRIPP
jgi:hypothetical protein